MADKKTLRDYIPVAEQKKIPIELGGILASLEEALTKANENSIKEFRAEAEEVKNRTLEEIRAKMEEADIHVKSLKPEKGDKGDDYILTDRDKSAIAGKIKVPIVEKIIEKTEIIKEQPIVKEVAVAESAEQIREKLSSLEDEKRLDAKHIKNLPTPRASMSRSKSYFKVSSLTGTIDGDNKRFYMSEAPKYGTQVFVIANGSNIEKGTGFTVSGNWITYVEAPYSYEGFTWTHYAIIYRP